MRQVLVSDDEGEMWNIDYGLSWHCTYFTVDIDLEALMAIFVCRHFDPLPVTQFW